jgi:peptide/nickel transport system ATP-binding protein
MYAGKLVELALSAQLLERPMHPYTVGLMNSFPSITGQKRRLQGIPGSPPDLTAPPRGCRFNPRCFKCIADGSGLYRQQTEAEPELREIEPGHWVACHAY